MGLKYFVGTSVEAVITSILAIKYFAEVSPETIDKEIEEDSLNYSFDDRWVYYEADSWSSNGFFINKQQTLLAALKQSIVGWTMEDVSSNFFVPSAHACTTSGIFLFAEDSEVVVAWGSSILTAAVNADSDQQTILNKPIIY